MRIYWWQGGLHLDPESDEERAGLLKLGDTLPMLGTMRLERLKGREDGVETAPVVRSTREEVEAAETRLDEAKAAHRTHLLKTGEWDEPPTTRRASAD